MISPTESSFICESMFCACPYLTSMMCNDLSSVYTLLSALLIIDQVVEFMLIFEFVVLRARCRCNACNLQKTMVRLKNLRS